MRCPVCGDDGHIYKRADMLWMGEQEGWEVVYEYDEVDCTNCDFTGTEDDFKEKA